MSRAKRAICIILGCIVVAGAIYLVPTLWLKPLYILVAEGNPAEIERYIDYHGLIS